jgi:hypothetical protein
MTDGTSQANAEFRRNVGFYYDLVKADVERIVKGLAAELENLPVTAVGVTPGWLRSEMMLENFGVTEASWRDACAGTPGFAVSESPAYIARGVAALAAAGDADRRRDPGRQPYYRLTIDLARADAALPAGVTVPAGPYRGLSQIPAEVWLDADGVLARRIAVMTDPMAGAGRRLMVGSPIRGGRPRARGACRSSTGPGRCKRRG